MDENTRLLSVLSLLSDLIKLNRNGNFSSNEYYTISADKLPSWIERYYFFLNLFVIQKGHSNDSLLAAYRLYDHDSNEEKVTMRMNNTLRSLEKSVIKINGETYGPLIGRAQQMAYLGKQNVYSLSADGFRALLNLSHIISAPESFQKVSSEDYVKLHNRISKRSFSNHSLFSAFIISNLLPTVSSGNVCDFEQEMGRTTAYALEKSIRKKEIITPDVSLRYMTSDGIPVPVFFEADLYTEKGALLSEKAGRLMRFGNKMKMKFGQFPCTVCFVTNEKNYYTRVKLDKEKELLRQRQAERACYKNNYTKMFLYGLIERFANEFREVERIYEGHYSVTEVIDHLIPILKTDNGEAFANPFEAVDYFEKFKQVILDWEADESERAGEPILMDSNNFERFFSTENDVNYAKDARLSRSISATDNRRSSLYRSLDELIDSHIWFENGQSIYFLNQAELPCVLPSMLPYTNGLNEVKHVLEAVGFDTNKLNHFWSSRPLLENQFGYYVNMRNAFLVGDVTVGFEDLSYDISALARLRDFVAMPSDLVKKKLLIVIINDDLDTAVGEPLEKVNYWAGHTQDLADKDGTVKDHFRNIFGMTGNIPFKYHIGCDFCFIKRSEFLDTNSAVHPFILMGNVQRYDRTTEGMESDRRTLEYDLTDSYHQAFMNVDDSFHGYLKEQY